MPKRKIWRFILCVLILSLAAALAAAGFTQSRKVSAWSDSIERRVRPDGTVYELISVDNSEMCLRKITSDGLVTGYYPLPKSGDESMYTAYHTIGLLGQELYLYSYETTGDTPVRRNEVIVAYDMQNGNRRIVAAVPAPDTLDVYDVFFAQNTSGSAVYLGYMELADNLLKLRRIETETGAVQTMHGVEMPFRPAAISVAESGELFALARDSKVYALDGTKWNCLYEPELGEAAANMTVGAEGDVFLFIASDEGGRALISTTQNRRFEPMDLDTGGFTRLHIAQRDRWVALDEYGRYVVFYDGQRHTISALTPSLIALWDTKPALIAAVLALSVTGVLTFFKCVRLKRRLRLLPKLLIIIITLFTLGIIALLIVAQRNVRESVEDGLRNSILEYAVGIIGNIDTERFARIDWSEPFEDEYYNELHAYLDEITAYRMMDVLDGENLSSHNANISCWIYRADGGMVYTAFGGHSVTGLNVKYYKYSLEGVVWSDLQQTEQPVSAYINSLESNIRFKAVICPILAENGIIGYLVIARPMMAVDAAVGDLSRGITVAGFLVFAAVVGALIIVLALSTKTLTKLKRGALDVSGGDYSVRVETKAWDETGEIAAAFNKMAQSVESSIHEITQVSDGYKRFVPDKLVELLDGASISALRPGDHKNLTATHILLFTDSFENLRDGELFDALSRFYNLVLPCIVSADGLVTQHSPRGLAAVFEKPPETVLRAILSLFMALDREGEAECHVFMSYSGAMLGVTGGRERLNLIAVSRLIYESYSVGMAGKRFGTRLIVPQSVYDELGEDAERYNHRFLGFLRDENGLRRLYDFFDCDTAEIKVKKIALKERFENGVELYYNKEYSKARRLFVEIIKEFPEDTASREFLRRSHAGYETGGLPRPLIEIQ